MSTEKKTEMKTATRGRVFTGTVIAAKMTKTVTVQWERRRFIPKYERYEKRRTKLKAHNPDSIGAKEGDIVMVTNIGAYNLTFSNRFPYSLPIIHLVKEKDLIKIFDPSREHDFSIC